MISHQRNNIYKFSMEKTKWTSIKEEYHIQTKISYYEAMQLVHDNSSS